MPLLAEKKLDTLGKALDSFKLFLDVQNMTWHGVQVRGAVDDLVAVTDFQGALQQRATAMLQRRFPQDELVTGASLF